MLHNIPFELRSLDQWVVASGAAGPDGKPSKEPLNPRTGARASVTDPDTWATFEEARHCGHPLKGFVLSPDDPFTIIDLDAPETPEQEARHAKIYEAFQTYAELSQSGHGIHLICRGSVPKGARRDKVEVYSSGRYMICTGNVLRAAPVADCQALLDILFAELGGASDSTSLQQVTGTLTDDEVLTMATEAVNAAKFSQLWNGVWEGQWPSQSEADFALLSMLGFYTEDNEQVRRLFRRCALGQRAKATKNNRYLDYALEKIRAKAPPMVDLTPFLGRLGTTEDAHGDGAPMVTDEPPHLFPPGLIGEIADYILASSIRPVPEMALAAAIALCAGIAGRSYNISGTGLNQYLILVAPTGRGKEGMATGIDNLVAAVQSTVPMIDRFIGPAAFASGQALVRVLDKQPCFVSVLGEVGLLLQQICAPNANGAQVMLKKVLLDAYGKSGFSKVMRESVYSDTDKNTKVVQAPNITLLGETSPEKLFNALGGEAISEGLLPRFIVFEYDGPRPPQNEQPNQPPSPALVDQLAALASVALAAEQNRNFVPVTVSPQADAILRAFNRECDEIINSASHDQTREVWNRAHLKVLKLSALVAVGINPHQPVVSEKAAQWAADLVRKDSTRLHTRFAAGDVGTGDTRMEADVLRALADWSRLPVATKRGYKVSDKLLKSGLVPLRFLRQRCRLLTSFRNHRFGASAALTSTLKNMVEAGEVTEIGAAQVKRDFGFDGPLFCEGHISTPKD